MKNSFVSRILWYQKVIKNY